MPCCARARSPTDRQKFGQLTQSFRIFRVRLGAFFIILNFWKIASLLLAVFFYSNSSIPSKSKSELKSFASKGWISFCVSLLIKMYSFVYFLDLIV